MWSLSFVQHVYVDGGIDPDSMQEVVRWHDMTLVDNIPQSHCRSCGTGLRHHHYHCGVCAVFCRSPCLPVNLKKLSPNFPKYIIVPFHFLFRFGSCRVNALNMVDSELRILKCGVHAV